MLVLLKPLSRIAVIVYIGIYVTMFIARQEPPTSQWLSFIGLRNGQINLYFFDFEKNQLSSHAGLRNKNISDAGNYYQQNLIFVSILNTQHLPPTHDFYSVRPFSNQASYLFTDVYSELAWSIRSPVALVTIPRDDQWDIFRRTGQDRLERLTDDVYPETGISWTYNGDWILFTSGRDGNREIYKMKSDGSEIQRLTRNGFSDVNPSASPDGHWIAFVSLRDGEWEIYVKEENAQPIRLTHHLGLDDYPTWSPDGEWIAYVSEDNRTQSIYLMRPDGSDKYSLVSNFDSIRNLVWNPIYDYRLNKMYPLTVILAVSMLMRKSLLRAVICVFDSIVTLSTV